MTKPFILKILILWACLITSLCTVPVARAETSKIERLEGKVEPELDKGLYKLTTGIDYSEGAYTFDRKVRVQAAHATLSYEKVNLFLAATFVGLNIYAPDAKNAVILGGAPPFSKRHGVGDISLNANYIYFLSNATYADLSAVATLPTGNAQRGLGDGQYYYLVNADVTHHFGTFYLYAGAGYNWRDQPWNLTARNAFRVGTGGGVTFNDKWDTSLTLSARDVNPADNSSFRLQSVTNYYHTSKLKFSATYDWQEAVDILAPYSAVTGTVEYGINEKDIIRFYAQTGLSSAAPDIATGLSFEHAF